MRLAFDNGTVYVPGKYHPGLYGIGQLPDYAQEFNDANLNDLYNNDPGSKLVNFASTLPSAAITGASTAEMLGGSLKADIIGGAQAGLMTVAPFTGPAAPFVLTAASLIGPIASMFKGCGVTCTQATTIANNAEAAAESLLQRWNSEPVKYRSIQQAYLAAQQDVWNYISGSCQKIGGQGGQQCIADRQRGGKYDFFIHYVDPVANETDIVPDPVVPGVEGVLSSVTGLFSSLPIPLILGGAGILLLLMVSGSGDGK